MGVAPLVSESVPGCLKMEGTAGMQDMDRDGLSDALQAFEDHFPELDPQQVCIDCACWYGCAACFVSCPSGSLSLLLQASGDRGGCSLHALLSAAEAVSLLRGTQMMCVC